MVNIICVAYYNVIIAYPIVFILKSFAQKLPWMDCDNEWNTPYCLEVNRAAAVNSSSELISDFRFAFR